MNIIYRFQFEENTEAHIIEVGWNNFVIKVYDADVAQYLPDAIIGFQTVTAAKRYIHKSNELGRSIVKDVK